MELKILAFSHLAERLGFRERTVTCTAGETPREILLRLAPDFPLAGVRVALDEEYQPWDSAVGAAREMALIPPVSGG